MHGRPDSCALPDLRDLRGASARRESGKPPSANPIRSPLATYMRIDFFFGAPSLRRLHHQEQRARFDSAPKVTKPLPSVRFERSQATTVTVPKLPNKLDRSAFIANYPTHAHPPELWERAWEDHCNLWLP